VTLGLSTEEINAIKGFVRRLQLAIASALQASTRIKQLLGTGV
jgi:hypothetical protein